jgi:membrane protein DedA with SNARE-associated domain
VLASIYAGTGHDLNIFVVIAAAAACAILGDNAGFWLGRKFGYVLVLRYGRYIGLPDARVKLGQYIFLRHGGKVVFFGRFIAYLRVLAALLPGVNRMDWGRFLVANATGGILWAAIFGWGAYWFGKVLLQATGPLAVGLLMASAILLVWFVLFLRGHELQLQAAAERTLPGKLH